MIFQSFNTTANICELAKAKRGLKVIFEIVGRSISVIEYYESFHWFFANTLENRCYGILLKCLRRMLGISYCDVIYYVIYVICFHYVRKTINPLFAWASSCVILKICVKYPIHWQKGFVHTPLFMAVLEDSDRAFIEIDLISLIIHADRNFTQAHYDINITFRGKNHRMYKHGSLRKFFFSDLRIEAHQHKGK